MSDELASGPVPRRRSRALAGALVLLVVGGLLAVRLTQGSDPAPEHRSTPTPSPSITAWAAGSVTLLPPLCGTTTVQPPCPRSTPAGVYESELTGLSVEHPFTFRLPAGWSVSMLEYGNGLDLRAGRGPGFSLLLSPRPVSSAGDAAATAYDAFGLATSVAAAPSVLATQPARTVVDGATAWSVDTRLRPGRSANADCRIGVACAPLFLQYVSLIGRGQDVAAGAIAGRTVRLVFFDLPKEQTALIWIWDTRSTGTVGPVVDSVHFCTVAQGCPTVTNPFGRQPSPAPS
jgi:hypothetical protein